VVVNLRFDDEHANVRQPTDTAGRRERDQQTAGHRLAARRLRVMLRRFGRRGDRRARGRVRWQSVRQRLRHWRRPWARCPLGREGHDHQPVESVWILTAELFDVTTGKAVLADSYEIKGDARTMAPAGAHVFAQRVEKTIGGAR